MTARAAPDIGDPFFNRRQWLTPKGKDIGPFAADLKSNV